MCRQSPAKILRNVKRMTKFNRRKSSPVTKCVPNLSIVYLPHLDIPPSQESKLSFCSQATIAIPPANPKPKLSHVKLEAIDIRPKKIYDPTTLNACETLFKKHFASMRCEIEGNCAPVLIYNFGQRQKCSVSWDSDDGVFYAEVAGVVGCGVHTVNLCWHLPHPLSDLYALNQMSVM